MNTQAPPTFVDTHRDVVISSTSIDLKEHREMVKDAVWRANMFPQAMEHGGAMPMDAVRFSLGLVDRAEVYVGLFGYRYGYIPKDPSLNPNRLSITELEYRRAEQRGIPILIFIMHEEHSLTPAQIERDPEGLEKLNKLKKELQERYVVSYFKSPEDLGKQVLQALLSPELQKQLKEWGGGALADASTNGASGNKVPLPPMRRLPIPPQPHIAHPYILKHGFVGRDSELLALDEWAASLDSIMIVEALGGMGKSALTWNWTQRVIASRQPPQRFAGIIWWSFYEENASMDNFIRDTLAYISGAEVPSFADINRAEREQTLFTAMKKTPYLIVMDGIERIMGTYRYPEVVLSADHAGEDASKRSFSDPQDDEFISKLATCTPSKILMSTRLIPRVLQNRAGDLVNGVRRLKLEGLRDSDALRLMENLGVRGTQYKLNNFLEQFGYHSLLLSVTAGRILNYRPAPGDFDRWYEDEGRQLSLESQDLAQRRTHILQFALSGLDASMKKLLDQIATFRDQVHYDTLRRMNPYLAQYGAQPSDDDAMQATLQLHSGLQELEERGLLLWDRRTNHYDLPPIVRVYIRQQMGEEDKRTMLERIHAYFASLPPIDAKEVDEMEQLKAPLQLYDTLVRLRRYDEAMEIYSEQLKHALQFKLAAYNVIIDLLTPLFTRGLNEMPSLETWRNQKTCLSDMATALYYVGQISESMQLKALRIKLSLESKRYRSLGGALRNYATSLRQDMNQLAGAHKACQLGLELAEAMQSVDDIAMSHLYLLSLYQDMGWYERAETAYGAFLRHATDRREMAKWRSAAERFYAEALIYQGKDAKTPLERSAEMIAGKNSSAVDARENARLLAENALQQGQVHHAVVHFQNTIKQARRSGISVAAVEGRLAYAFALQQVYDRALSLIELALQEADEQRIYDLHCSAAEVYLLLAQDAAGRDVVDVAAQYKALAKQYAERAYKQAQSDGEPYVWAWRLNRARRVLAEVNGGGDDLKPPTSRTEATIPYESDIRGLIERLKQDPGQIKE